MFCCFVNPGCYHLPHSIIKVVTATLVKSNNLLVFNGSFVL